MKTTKELTYIIELHDGILNVILDRNAFWDNIHLHEVYEDSYIHMNFVTNYYFQSFGNMENKKRHIISYYNTQHC